jgi:alpha-L-fucosidase
MPVITHKGKLVKKDEQYQFLTRFTAQSEELEVPMEEILEDFENKSVEITFTEAHFEPPMYAGKLPNWETTLENTVDSDYKFCSEQGRETFLDMKFGLMVHFGLYTHLGLLESWSVNARNAPKWFQDIYYTMWQVWNPSEFDAEEWATLVKRSGMQFIQITTKHHEGFCLWDTKTKTKARKRIGSQSGVVVDPVVDTEINFSVMDTPFKRDIVAELSTAFRKNGLGFGLYFSHIDWNDPNFRWDEANRSFDPKYNAQTSPEEWNAFVQREWDQLTELFTNYGKIDQIFFDGTWWNIEWENMKKLVKHIRKLQPDCMFSDRGLGPYADFTSPERWIPAEETEGGKKASHKVWQCCDPIGTHWSYVPDEKYKDKKELLRNFVDVVAKGGTFVFDQGPMPNGRFPQEAIDVLEYMGRWLAVNGEAIYATRPWKKSKQGDDVYFTRSKDQKTLYAINFGWPYQRLELNEVNIKAGSQIFMYGIQEPFPWKLEGQKLVIEIPSKMNELIPCECAFAFKIELAK